MKSRIPFACLAALTCAPAMAQGPADEGLTYGPRPAWLISQMEDGPLKSKLDSCLAQTPTRTDFSIGHRGAPLLFPEHTVESNVAAARMGAGILECDVTFTKDHELVCRHAQNDLHTTTDILVSDLADTCVQPFAPAVGDQTAGAECRTSEITLDEYRTLRPKMDAADASATTPEAYQGGVAPFRTTLYGTGATIMTHADSIALFQSLGAKFTPELKSPTVKMPHDGFTQADYAQKLVDEYKAAGIPASNVWLQSFDLSDILYWIREEPAFGAQAVYLDDRYEAEDKDEGLIDPMDAATFRPSMAELKALGVNYLAPPLWMLVTTQGDEIVPSVYATEAQAAGLNLIAWSLERSGPLNGGGGWYYQSITDVTDGDGVMFELVDVLAQDVGVVGIFSDWPATVTYYANCMGL